MKKNILFAAILIPLLIANFAFGQTTYINGATGNGNFESGATGWTVANASTNKWWINTTSKCSGTRGAYIGTATGNNNYTNTVLNISHLYKTVAISFTPGETNISLSFNYKCQGESSFDGLKVYLTSAIPVAGTSCLIADQVGASWYNLQGTCTAANITVPGSYAGTTKYLVFQWQNDGSVGTNPAITVDDVVLTSAGCPAITPPYTESFESITAPNTLPTCMAATNLGTSTYTYVAPTGVYNQAAKTGTDYASFKYDCNDWIFTQPLNLTGGIAYDFSFWYVTDGLSGWTTLQAKFGNAQNSGAMTGTITGATVSSPTNTSYVQCSGSFTPAVSGIYYCGINCVSTFSPWYLTIDDINVSASAPMTYVSCTTTQNTASTTPNATNQDVIGVQIVTTGNLAPLNATSFTINTTGTTNPATDIQNLKIYYTGISNVFSPVSQFGTTIAAPNGSYVIPGSQALLGGTNYFWVTYDIKPGATISNVVDARCTALTVTTPRTPTVTSPAGNRPIVSCPLGTGGYIVTLPYSATGQTTCGMVDNFTSANTTVCGSTSYYTGEDVVYQFTPTTSGCVTVTLTSSGSYTGLMLYAGCPSLGYGGTCVAQAQSSTGNKNLVVQVTSGTTYYLIVDSWSSPVCNPYDISISLPSTTPANDLPCNAQWVLVGDMTPGDNTCAANTGEPAAPSCWTNGSINTVWYKFNSYGSTSVRIKTVSGTLTNTQIAVYSGTCGPGLTLVACNDDVPDCGTSSYYNSELTTAVTINTWYYVAVDGYMDDQGTFSVVFIDGASPWPPVPGQDCISDVPVCAPTFTIGNPGYQAVGNICDFPGGGTNCLLSGERGSAWYAITVNANGNLMFTIEPNDALPTGPGVLTSDGTDYDFAIWKKTGSGAVTCAAILAGATPLRCNYSGIGVTGLYTGGNCPTAVNTYTNHSYTPTLYDAAFEPPLAVTNGEVYWLVISNFSNSTSGFTINFLNSTNGFNFTVPNPLIWTGGATTTNWFDPINWGNCSQIPTSTIDCIISSAPAVQPVINAPGAVCRSITINNGASLTINGGFALDVWGNYDNQGLLNAATTSTVNIRGAAAQTLNGVMVASSAFGNLTINKTAGSAILNQHIECAGDLNTILGTSILNENSNQINVAGNITFFNSTLITGSGTNAFVRCFGSNNQIISQGLNNGFWHFKADKTAGNISLSNNMTVKYDFALINGIINTGPSKVILEANSAAYNFTLYNKLSYINGNLRRNYNATYPINYNWCFPIGDATNYRLAEITCPVTVFTGITYFDSKYVNPFTNTRLYDPLKAFDGANIYASVSGIWQIDPNVQPTTGVYNIKLWFNGGTLGANPFTLSDNLFGPLKRPSTSTIAFDWTALGGTLNAPSTPGRTVAGGYAQRNGWTSFSHFGIGSTTVPLPVDLVEFTAICKDNSAIISWTTASELNNDYFTIERSANGVDYEILATVKGSGNSNSMKSYSYIDLEALNGTSYYRIKQTDFDGKYKYYPSTSVHCDASASSNVNFFPNPFNNELVIELTNISSNEANVVLFDLLGNKVFERKLENISETNNKFIFDLSNLSSGIYFANFKSNDFVKVTKISKK